jgi:hypothetical protein
MKRTPLLLMLAAAAVLGCQKDPAAPAPHLLAAKIIIVVGDSQAGTVHAALPAPVVVRVLDDSQRPMHGQLVNFVVTSGGGHVFAGSALTDTSGEARELWTLGDTAGIQHLAARAVDPTTGEAITFAEIVAIAHAGPLAYAGFTVRLLRAFGGAPLKLPGSAVDLYGNAVRLPPVTALDGMTADSTLAVRPASPGLFRFVLGIDTLRLLVYVPSGSFRAVTRRADTTWTETGTLGFRSFDQLTVGSTVDTLASYMLTGLVVTRAVGANRPDSLLVGSLNAPSLQHQVFAYPTPSNTTIVYWRYWWPGVGPHSEGMSFAGIAAGWIFTGAAVDSLTVTP